MKKKKKMLYINTKKCVYVMIFFLIFFLKFVETEVCVTVKNEYIVG